MATNRSFAFESHNLVPSTMQGAPTNVNPMGSANPAAPGTISQSEHPLEVVEGLTQNYYQKVAQLEGFAKSFYNRYGKDITQPNYDDPDAMQAHQIYLKGLAAAQNTANQLRVSQAERMQAVAQDRRIAQPDQLGQQPFDIMRDSYSTQIDSATTERNKIATDPNFLATDPEAANINTQQQSRYDTYMQQAQIARENGNEAQAQGLEYQAGAVQFAQKSELANAKLRAAERANRNTDKGPKYDELKMVLPEVQRYAEAFNGAPGQAGWSSDVSTSQDGKPVYKNYEYFGGLKFGKEAFAQIPRLQKHLESIGEVDNLVVDYAAKDPEGNMMLYFKPVAIEGQARRPIPPMPLDGDNLSPFIVGMITSNRNEFGISRGQLNTAMMQAQELGGFDGLFSGSQINPDVIVPQGSMPGVTSKAYVASVMENFFTQGGEPQLPNGKKVVKLDQPWWKFGQGDKFAIQDRDGSVVASADSEAELKKLLESELQGNTKTQLTKNAGNTTGTGAFDNL